MAIVRGNSLLMPKQWAEDGSTVIPNPPVAGTVYRDETVDADNIAEGQQYDGVADSARWNQLLYIITGILKDTLAHGILPWLNTQDYAEGAVVIGSNGELYRAKIANGPSTSNSKDPVSDTTSQTWYHYVTLMPNVAVEPLNYSYSDGLKLALGDGLQVTASKLALKILQNKGLSLTSNGLQVLVADSWVKFDSTGKLAGAYNTFSGNIDDLHVGAYGDCGIYYVTTSATGTHPQGRQGNYMLMMLGNVQLVLGGAGFLLTRNYAASTSKWSAWDNVAEKASAMPVGAVYVQFANQPDPTSLFGGTWSNISSSFAGMFFRSEGGAAAAFGGSQNDNGPDVTGKLVSFYDVGNFSSAQQGAFYAAPESRTDRFTGSNTSSEAYISVNFALSRVNTKYSGINEFRPVNSTIRIWKRTA